MDFINVPEVVGDVFFGVWLAIQQIYENFGLGTRIVLTILWILFLIYLFLDITFGIINLCRKFMKLINGEDPNA